MASSTRSAPRWARVVSRRPGLVVALAFVVFGLATARIVSIEFNTDLAALLPAEDPVVSAYMRSQRLFSAESVIIFVERRGGELSTARVDRLLELADEVPVFRSVDRLPFGAEVPRDLFEHLPQLVPADSRVELLERLSREGLEERAILLRRRLATPVSPLVRQLLREDPLGLVELLPPVELGEAADWKVVDGTLLSADRRAALLFAELRTSESDEEALSSLREALDRLRSEWQRGLELEGIEPGEFRVGFTGPAVIGAHESQVIRGETVRSVVVSLVAVVLLFAVAFRRIGAFLWLGLPLAGVVLVSLVAGDLVFGDLNILAASGAAIVIGLGVDFGIHVYSRTLDRRAEGREPPSAAAEALGEVGLANGVAALTTSCAFLAMTVSAISGIRALGVLTAIGLGVALVVMMTVFPAMLLLTGAVGRDAAVRRVPGRYLDPWIRLVARHPRRCAVALGAVTVGALLFIPGLDFGAQPYEARLELNPALQVQEAVEERFGTHFRGATLMVSGDSAIGLERGSRRLLAVAEELQEEGDLVEVVTPLAWVPRVEVQEKTLAAVGRQVGSAESLASDLRDAMERAGVQPESFETGIENLRAGVRASPIGLEEMLQSDSLRELTRHFVRRDEGRLFSAIYLLPRDQEYGEASYEELRASFAAVALPPDVEFILVTPKLLSQQIRRESMQQFWMFLAVMIPALLAPLVFFVREPFQVLVAVAPVVLSVLWTLGMAGALGMHLTLENAAAFPLVLGIGVDDALHVLYAVRLHPERSILACLRESGKAVVLTTLTTVLAFASLAFAGHPLLRSLGILTGLGITFCLVTTLTVVPAASVVLARHRWER